MTRARKAVLTFIYMLWLILSGWDHHAAYHAHRWADRHGLDRR